MEQQERTFRAERDELMKSLGGAATVVMAQIVNSSANADKKRKEAAVEGAVVGPNGLTGNKKLDKATKAGETHIDCCALLQWSGAQAHRCLLVPY
jgi:hypothetical protein